MAHIPSPDKDLIDQVLFDRLVNNMEHPIPDHESSKLLRFKGAEGIFSRNFIF